MLSPANLVNKIFITAFQLSNKNDESEQPTATTRTEAFELFFYTLFKAFQSVSVAAVVLRYAALIYLFTAYVLGSSQWISEQKKSDKQIVSDHKPFV